MTTIVGLVCFLFCCIFVLYQYIGHVLYFFRYHTLHHKFYIHYDGALQYMLNIFTVIATVCIAIDVIFGIREFGITILPTALFFIIVASFLVVEGGSRIVNYFSNIRDNFPER